MALSDGLGITGILFVVIGIIMAIVGIILLIVNQEMMKPWYIWFLLVGGVIIGILGGIMLAFALARNDAPRRRYVDQQEMMVRKVYVQPAEEEEEDIPTFRPKEQQRKSVSRSTTVVKQKVDPNPRSSTQRRRSVQKNVPFNVVDENGVTRHQGDIESEYEDETTEDINPFAAEQVRLAKVADAQDRFYNNFK